MHTWSKDTFMACNIPDKKENYDKSDIQQLNLLVDGVWKIIHRKRSEIALRKSEEHYRLPAENPSDNIWTGLSSSST